MLFSWWVLCLQAEREKKKKEKGSPNRAAELSVLIAGVGGLEGRFLHTQPAVSFDTRTMQQDITETYAKQRMNRKQMWSRWRGWNDARMWCLVRWLKIYHAVEAIIKPKPFENGV